MNIRSTPSFGGITINASRNQVLRNTYWLLALSLIPTVIGAVVGLSAGVPMLMAGSPIMGMLVFSGVFERNPKLRVVCVEADAGWAPHFSYRMDHAYKRHRYWMKGKELARRAAWKALTKEKTFTSTAAAAHTLWPSGHSSRLSAKATCSLREPPHEHLRPLPPPCCRPAGRDRTSGLAAHWAAANSPAAHRWRW